MGEVSRLWATYYSYVMIRSEERLLFWMFICGLCIEWGHSDWGLQGESQTQYPREKKEKLAIMSKLRGHLIVGGEGGHGNLGLKSEHYRRFLANYSYIECDTCDDNHALPICEKR